jgi:hypothetical protein
MVSFDYGVLSLVDKSSSDDYGILCEFNLLRQVYRVGELNAFEFPG